MSEIVHSPFLNGLYFIDAEHPKTVTLRSMVQYNRVTSNPPTAYCSGFNQDNAQVVPLMPLQEALPFTLPLALPLKYTYLPQDDKIGLKHAIYILQLLSSQRDNETSTVPTTTTTVPPTTPTTSTTSTVIIQPSTTTSITSTMPAEPPF
jgi:hypothetical protein